MNSGNRTLRKAIKLLFKRQLTRCIQLLEPKISLFLDNADYFYLLGRCYFTAGDSENAKLYLQRGLESDPNHEDIQLMQACFALKERDTYRAISIWLRLENLGCHRVCLRYGLDQIRRINDIEELHNFTRSPKFVKLFPSLPGSRYYRLTRFLWRLLLILLLLYAAWLSYSIGAPKARQWYKEWRQQRQQSAVISLAGLETNEYLAFTKKSSLFSFQKDELKKLIRNIRKNYDSYNDNLVQRDINKIFYSNASDKVKTKFRLIEGLLGAQQEIYSLQNNFSFLQVREAPQLYQNCFVRWHGKPTNVQLGSDGKLQFILLVGYTDGRVLEGQVPVQMDALISLPVDQPITVFGRVQILDLSTTLNAKVTDQGGPRDSRARDSRAEDSKDGDKVAAETSIIFYIAAKTLARS